MPIILPLFPLLLLFLLALASALASGDAIASARAPATALVVSLLLISRRLLAVAAWISLTLLAVIRVHNLIDCLLYLRIFLSC